MCVRAARSVFGRRWPGYGGGATFEPPQVVQTDNGAEFQSQFHWHLEARDIRHVYIRPRTPRLNGKVERWRRVDDQKFYQLPGQGRHH